MIDPPVIWGCFIDWLWLGSTWVETSFYLPKDLCFPYIPRSFFCFRILLLTTYTKTKNDATFDFKIMASLCLFSSFSHYNWNWKNQSVPRCCDWDLNPGPQEGRRRRIHWAMAASFVFWLRISFLCLFIFSITVFFLKKWAIPCLFSFIFGHFKQALQFFTTNRCKKISIQYTAPGFKPTTFWTWVITHKHPPYFQSLFENS